MVDDECLVRSSVDYSSVPGIVFDSDLLRVACRSHVMFRPPRWRWLPNDYRYTLVSNVTALVLTRHLTGLLFVSVLTVLCFLFGSGVRSITASRDCVPLGRLGTGVSTL